MLTRWNIHLTGAALRSAEAAYAAAEAHAATLAAAVDRLRRAASVAYVDATAADIAELIAARADVRAIDEAKDKLAPRYQSEVRYIDPERQVWPMTEHPYMQPLTEVPDLAAKARLRDLVAAGVAMSDVGWGTPEYWRDAAARGC